VASKLAEEKKMSEETSDQDAVRLGCNAPRVTAADLEANIVHEEYVVKVTHSGQVLRWCILTTKSGFAVSGDPSAAVSKENDRAELGEKYARENAIRKLWVLMAFALKEQLSKGDER
jgi:hypothetical protein